MRAGKFRHCQWLGLGLLALTCTARADYKDDYAHGVKAYEAGDYGAAQKWLREALDAHAEPAARVRLYGQVFAPYLPQHYLGLIALKQGDCATVRAQWGSSENRQIVLQLPEIASEEERAGAACAETAVAKNPEPAKPPVTERPTGSEAPPNKPIASIPPKPVVPPPKPPEKPPVEKPPVAEKAGPPDSLVQAFEQYLGGRYAEVARINPDSYSDTRARFHAYLVRAAAKYTQARIAADDALLTGAKADAAAARALDGHTAPDATLFSPAFREFYNGSR